MRPAAPSGDVTIRHVVVNGLRDPDQVEAKLRAYQAVGIESFILSGYPLDDEAERFAELVLPRFAGEVGVLTFP